MNNPMSVVWLVLMIVFAVAEAATLGLTSIWFAFGSLAAMAASLLGANWVVQLVVFLAVSAVLLYFTRPLAQKYFGGAKTRTNADRVVGMHGLVIQRIDNEQASGQVRVGSQVWTARSADGSVIGEGETVVVRSISGVKLMVEKQAAPAAEN